METYKYLINFYNNYDEDCRLTTKHGTVEFLTTMRYIKKYIRSGACVLEIGAGTGRYSHTLARQGYTVDAVELVNHNIEFSAKILCRMKKYLSRKETPWIYYVISDGSVIDEGFKRKKFNVADYIKNGMLNGETFVAKSEPKDLFELVRKEDIDEIMSVFPTTRLHYVASDGFSRILRETIDSIDDDTFELYLKYHFAICERADMVGVTAHSLDIFKKGFES